MDVHAHLGMSLFLAPEIDLGMRTPRVRHYLDCDAEWVVAAKQQDELQCNKKPYVF